MTKAELQDRLDRVQADNVYLQTECNRLRELNRLHDRVLRIVENTQKISTNYWSGS